MSAATLNEIYTIEVFKTNVGKVSEAKKIKPFLLKYFPGAEINFDLQDCDRVLRLAGYNIEPCLVKQLLQLRGFKCDVLEG